MEVLKAINTLPAYKSPGPNVYSNEYYKIIADTLASYLSKVANKAAEVGLFPKESVEELIVAIPKPGKPPTNAANFRLVSLLNSDIKIYTELLANF